jgi:predicted nucleic acid-binding protein
LSFADSIIYATAQQEKVKLITADDHFENLPDVIYFEKKS